MDNIYQLYDAFVVDFTDDTLYYVKNNQIWSIEGTKTDYTLADGSTIQNYPIEQIDQQYIEQRKFITKWQVAKGEEVVLLIYQNLSRSYNCTIEWGDGSKTILQDNVTLNGEKKTNYVEVIENGQTSGTEQTISSLSEAVTHTYTTDSENNIREIKISGIYEDFDVNNITAEQKEKLIGIKQWGNIRLKIVSFFGCTNLTGNIPIPNVEGLFSNCSDFSNGLFRKCNGLTGKIPENLFASCKNVIIFFRTFEGCSGLTGEIPENLFANCPDVVNFAYTFSGCSGLTGKIPAGLFTVNTKVTTFGGIFRECSGLTGKIPAGLFKNCSKVTNMELAFADTSITEIPINLFDTNNGKSNSITAMSGVFEGTKITTVPVGLFDLCTEVTHFGYTNWSYAGIFQDCKLLENVPSKLFYNNTKVIDFSRAFCGCTSLKEIPADIFNTNENCSMYHTFDSCSNLSKFSNKITIPENITNIEYIFTNCKNLKTTILLKVNPTTLSSYRNAFNGVNSELKINWSSPCTEEKIDEILAETGGSGIKGVEE